MFKKFFTNIDLLGNKIKDAITDLPTKSKHIANKEYVDNNTTLDTVKATTKISSKFPYIGNVGNLKFKEVFDKLLFPVINPKYINPEFVNIKLTNTGREINFNNSKISGILSVIYKNGDRPKSTKLKLKFSYDTDPVRIIDAKNIDDTYIEFNNIPLLGLNKIEITQTFGAVPIKQDSEGNNFIDIEFNNSQYELTHTINKQYFNDIFNIVEPVYYVNLNNSITEQFISDLQLKPTKSEFLSLLNFGNEFNINKTPNVVDIDYNIILLVIENKSLNKRILFETVDIDNKIITSTYFNINDNVFKPLKIFDNIDGTKTIYEYMLFNMGRYTFSDNVTGRIYLI